MRASEKNFEDKKNINKNLYRDKRTTIKQNKSIMDIVLLVLSVALVVAPILKVGMDTHFSYADEVVTLLLLGLCIFWHTGTLEKSDRVLGLFSIILFVIGVTGNIVFDIQDSPFAVAVDAFTCLKIFLVYLMTRRLINQSNVYIDMLILVGKAFIVVCVFLFIVHLSGVTHFGGDRKMLGILNYNFLYGHPTELAAFLVGFAAIFLLNKADSPWVITSAILLAATQRSKAIAMAGVLILLCIYNNTRRAKRIPPLWFLVGVAIVITLLGINQFVFYYGDDSSARSLLSIKGFEIAARYFPLGSGFATFGTYMSGVYYSPLYYSYGLSAVWGLIPGKVEFVSDCFWPAVVAQFGFIGLIVILVCIVSMFISYAKGCRCGRISFAAMACIPFYLLIASTSEASFFNFYTVFYAIVMAALSRYQSPMHYSNRPRYMKVINQHVERMTVIFKDTVQRR